MNAVKKQENTYITYYLDAMRRKVRAKKEEAEAMWEKNNNQTVVH